jgi:DNA-binding XRE family transcriptional regulator
MSEIRRARRVGPAPTGRSDPSALRFLVGTDLRATRERSGLTQATAGKVIGCTQTKINYMEIGRTRQKPGEVVALLRAYRADAEHIDRIASLSARTDQTTWWAPFSDVFPDWFKTFVGLEGLATREFTYGMALLPGQLQIADYAAALLVGSIMTSEIEAPQVVRARLARQRLTEESHPLRLQAVLEQHVIERVVGGPDVMRRQLEHLLTLMQRDNVEIHIMPTTVAVHGGLNSGDFLLLDFDQAQSIGYIEYATDALYIQDEDDVSRFDLTADRLVQTALSAADTEALIRARIAELAEHPREEQENTP